MGTRAIKHRYRKFNLCLETAERAVGCAAFPVANPVKKKLGGNCYIMAKSSVSAFQKAALYGKG